MDNQTEQDRQDKLSKALNWDENAPSNKFILNPVYWLYPILLWSFIIGASLFYNIQEIDDFAEQTAANKGRFVFQMIEDMRLWNARHGGVYVDRTETSPSNPYLRIPEKDIVTTTGRELTMINPAYMTRQLAGIIKENTQTLVNITSLNPINPNNLADEWEQKALLAFEKGTQERYDFLEIGNVNLFRYMAPLVADQACLHCHLHQGYKVGDVRGGISISFNSQLYLDISKQQAQTQYILHSIAWLLSILLTVFALSRLRSNLKILITTNKQQEEIVNIRTHDLQKESKKRHAAEAQFRRFIDATAEGIIILELDGICSFANPKAAHLLGLENPKQLIGRPFNTLSGHQNHEGLVSNKNSLIFDCLKNGQEAHNDEEKFVRKNGEVFPVEYNVSPVYEDNRQIGAILSFVDITKRKNREIELLKLSTAVEQSPATTIITDQNGRIEYVNKHFCDITGYKAHEVIGKNPRILKSGHTPYETYKNMWETINKGKSWKGELYNRKKDGTFFWDETLISPIKNSDGVITHFVSVKRDITEYKIEMSEAWHQANYDTLTNLPNRNLFDDRLENAVALASREERTLALLFIDLDGFKAINDTYGHDAGDQVLKKTANRLKACLRQSDTAARLGGDEFIIILQDSRSITAIESVAEKIIHEIKQEIHFKDDHFAISASIGISVMPDDTSSANELVRYADMAMYSAKQQGKNRFCHYKGFAINQSDKTSDF